MNNIMQYIFEVTLGSSLLFLGFYLVRNFLPFRFRRFYLLGCLILPLIFPLVSFDHSEEIITQVPTQVSQVFVESHFEPDLELTSTEPLEISQDSSLKTKEFHSGFNWTLVFYGIYLLVSTFLFIRFAFSLFTIYRLSKNVLAKENGNRYFLIENPNFTGGSFFSFIFINRSYLSDPAFKIILSHEQSHQRYWHSLDLLLSELYCVSFWINPIAWLLKKEIRLNAEYEADQFSARSFGKVNYANTLLQLSINSQNIGPMLSFSAMDTRNRVKQILEAKKRSWLTSVGLIPFLALSTWLISCEPEMMDFAAMDPQAALKNVKTVTTRYISHQKDTQQKDGNIIAIAYYLPDGTVDRVEQHMTYPYDYEKPFERKFLTSPNPTGVLHILDGFELGESENNILYGNDWPKYNKIEYYRANSESYRNSTTIDKNDEGLPVKFTVTTELNEDMFYNGGKRKQKGAVLSSHIQEFAYEDGKIISHMKRSESPESFIKYKNQKVDVGDSRLLHEMNYKYDGENLIEVSGRTPRDGSPSTTRMEYENGIMVKSSYFRNSKNYHYREFHYNSDGLKTRTEIYNVYGEPEYTILYDYEYY